MGGGGGERLRVAIVTDSDFLLLLSVSRVNTLSVFTLRAGLRTKRLSESLNSGDTRRPGASRRSETTQTTVLTIDSYVIGDPEKEMATEKKKKQTRPLQKGEVHEMVKTGDSSIDQHQEQHFTTFKTVEVETLINV